ncbi:glucose-1-phosphate thymidylyltransferase [Neobacillus niacini]|uniref:sugar phosphate nucleotidyltransferase n=1 Tax=Neobacillus niacini TaxID=86668 RepID=UPI001047CD2E|nr:sugar phosphate nucleotidyltransferase [Neobacillus niacini]MDR7079841.1 glucose-1-phosphate thymidylyltransferase [Neobacillus niacini]
MKTSGHDQTIGLIPCAGKGTRLGLPFSKELFPNVHSDRYNPIIFYTIEAMKKAEISHIIFTINPEKADLLRFLGNGEKFGMEFTYCIHPIPRSLPESIHESYHLLKEKTVLFAMPDTFVQPYDFLLKLRQSHENSADQREVTLACFQTNHPDKFGMVELRNEKVIRIEDKPVQTELNWMWGAMIWNPAFIEDLRHFIEYNKDRTEKELILSDALDPLIKKRLVQAACFDEGLYKDLGTYNEIKEWSRMNL